MHKEDKLLLVAGVIDWINDNLDNDINVDKVARKSGYSKWYFQRVFKNVTGITLGRYILALKFKMASQDLVLTKKTINDISFDAGFNSQQSFCRAFKNTYSITPSDYRNMFFAQPVSDKLDLAGVS